MHRRVVAALALVLLLVSPAGAINDEELFVTYDPMDEQVMESVYFAITAGCDLEPGPPGRPEIYGVLTHPAPGTLDCVVYASTYNSKAHAVAIRRWVVSAPMNRTCW